MQEKGIEIRILVPKFGCINERKNRLHDRIEFIFENSLWKNNRLSP